MLLAAAVAAAALPTARTALRAAGLPAAATAAVAATLALAVLPEVTPATTAVLPLAAVAAALSWLVRLDAAAVSTAMAARGRGLGGSRRGSGAGIAVGWTLLRGRHKITAVAALAPDIAGIGRFALGCPRWLGPTVGFTAAGLVVRLGCRWRRRRFGPHGRRRRCALEHHRSRRGRRGRSRGFKTKLGSSRGGGGGFGAGRPLSAGSAFRFFRLAGLGRLFGFGRFLSLLGLGLAGTGGAGAARFLGFAGGAGGRGFVVGFRREGHVGFRERDGGRPCVRRVGRKEVSRLPGQRFNQEVDFVLKKLGGTLIP
jgi:hypothetical protein